MEFLSLSRSRAKWNRFWFRADGRLSAAVARVGVATAVGMVLSQLVPDDYGPVVAASHPNLYEPVGILALLGNNVPSAQFLETFAAIAWVSTIAMGVGLFTRLSAVVSLLSALVLTSFHFSFVPHWSHQYNFVFSAHVAIAFARTADSLSVDVLIRRFRSERLPPAYPYGWPVQLAIFSVALGFAGAAVIKIGQDPLTWGWAFSDNLRHQLLTRFDWSGVERTALAEWLLQSSIRFRAAAFLNLVSQLAPMAALFLVGRPVLRFVLGSCFAVETMALGLVMDLWNPQWLPLTVLFVDWDGLWRRVRGVLRFHPGKGARSAESVPDRLHSQRSHISTVRGWLASAFVSIFVFYSLALAFVPRLDIFLNSYPFSRFPMFSKIRAKKPYLDHQSYELLGGQLSVDAVPPIPEHTRGWLATRHRMLFRVGDTQQLGRRLAAIAVDLEARLPDTKVKGVVLWLAVFQAPAYPAPAHLRSIPIAVLGDYRHEGGDFRFFRGRIGGDERDRRSYIEVSSRDMPIPDALAISYYANDEPTEIALVAERRGNRFYFDSLKGSSQVFVARVSIGANTPRPFFLLRSPRRP